MYELEDIELWKDDAGKKVHRFSVSGDRWIAVELEKGTIAGEHYHKGIYHIKNPEVHIILKGRIEYSLKDVRSNKTEKIVVEGPKIVKIKPYVYHELTALDDSMFLESFNEEAAKKDKFELS